MTMQFSSQLLAGLMRSASPRRRVLTLMGSGIMLVMLAVPHAAAQSSYKLVANGDVGETTLSKKDVSDVFLRRKVKWDDGSSVRPVDLPVGSRTRTAFSTDVLNRKVSAVKSYWQRMIFSGRSTPPPEVNNDREVLSFLRRNSGAIGYVASGTSIGDGLRVVRVSTD